MAIMTVQSRLRFMLPFILLWMVEGSMAQPCPQYSLVFNTQSQIDSFAILYPYCTELNVSVEINGPDITNLFGLYNIISIGDDLIINHNPSLQDLTGLNNLEIIWGSLNIIANDNLNSLTGLESLTQIMVGLDIFWNDNLTDISGLNSLDTTTLYKLYLFENSSLSVCDEPWLCNYLDDPHGSIGIYQNAPGCNNPPEIAEHCGLQLPCLPYGHYYFYTQEEIDSFQEDYPLCTELNGRVIISGPDINNLLGLEHVTMIERELSIDDIWQMTSLEGLNNLAFVGSSLHLNYTTLDSLTALNYLSYVGGRIDIINNGNLNSLHGLEGLDSLNGSCRIINNDSLIDLSGLDSLTYIAYSLEIRENNYLEELSGLNKLTSIGRDLILENNNILYSLDALTNLNSIGGLLKIKYNYGLTSLYGLDYIDAASIDELVIRNNLFLSDCEVKSICDYLASPNAQVEITFNATGCDTREEVEDACGLVHVNENIPGSLLIYPNPAHYSITIELLDEFSPTAYISIADIKGREPIVRQIYADKTVIDVASLPPGIYMLKVWNDRQSSVRKLVIY